MASIAFALPLTPGKTQEWRQWSQEMVGPRQSEYKASRQRLGITTEQSFLQQTPQGDMAVIYIEAADPGRAFQGLATSQDPFDVWFRQRVKDLFNGVDLTQPQPPPELVFDGLAR